MVRISNFLLLIFIAMLFLSSPIYAGGMRYLSPGEFEIYDNLLKQYGCPELKTIAAVYDDSFDPPRIGLKCVNNKNKILYQVYIEGDKIKKINKTADKLR